jgi:hypothetical protein
MKIIIENDDGSDIEMEAEQYYVLTITYDPVQNQGTGKTLMLPHYHHRSQGDLRELQKELKQKIEEESHAGPN